MIKIQSLLLVQVPINTRGNKKFQNRNKSKDSIKKRQAYHLVACPLNISFISAILPGPSTEGIPVISHFVKTFVKHIEFVTGGKNFEPQMVIFNSKKFFAFR